MEKLYNEKILELGLPNFLIHDLEEYKKGLQENSSLLDCLIEELKASINCAYVDRQITEEQKEYLYDKYIRGENHIKNKDMLEAKNKENAESESEDDDRFEE